MHYHHWPPYKNVRRISNAHPRYPTMFCRSAMNLQMANTLVSRCNTLVMLNFDGHPSSIARPTHLGRWFNSRIYHGLYGSYHPALEILVPCSGYVAGLCYARRTLGRSSET